MLDSVQARFCCACSNEAGGSARISSSSFSPACKSNILTETGPISKSTSELKFEDAHSRPIEILIALSGMMRKSQKICQRGRGQLLVLYRTTCTHEQVWHTCSWLYEQIKVLILMLSSRSKSEIFVTCFVSMTGITFISTSSHWTVSNRHCTSGVVLQHQFHCRVDEQRQQRIHP